MLFLLRDDGTLTRLLAPLDPSLIEHPLALPVLLHLLHVARPLRRRLGQRLDIPLQLHDDLGIPVLAGPANEIAADVLAVDLIITLRA